MCPGRGVGGDVDAHGGVHDDVDPGQPADESGVGEIDHAPGDAVDVAPGIVDGHRLRHVVVGRKCRGQQAPDAVRSTRDGDHEAGTVVAPSANPSRLLAHEVSSCGYRGTHE